MSATKQMSLVFVSLVSFIVFITSPCLAQNTGGASSQIQSVQTSQIAGQSNSHAGQARELAGRIPLSFEPNQGQASQDVQFLAHPSGNTLLLSPDGASFLLAAAGEQHDLANRARSKKLHTEVVRMRFAQANPRPKISATDPQPHTSSYFTGRDPKGWHTGVPHYASLRYQAVYPGIDLVFHGDQREFEYDFVLSPGADPNRIALAFQGGQVSLEPLGDLVISAQDGAELRHRRPVAYQWNEGKRTEVPAAFAIRADGSIGFSVGAYDRSRELLIDPVLVYSTYFGGAGNVNDTPGVAVDQLGNAYLYATAPSAGSFFPNASNAPSACPTCTTGGGMDVFIAKFDPTGVFLWATYLGGSGDEYSQPTDAGGITVNAGGVYVTGATNSTDFPVTSGAYEQTCNICAAGGLAGFVSKLAPDGQSLIYSTYLSAQGNGMCSTQASAIAVDSPGNAYIAGLTCDGVSTDLTESFPVSSSSVFQPTSQAINSGYGGGTAFVTKLDPTGSTILYSSYLGGSVAEMATSVSVDMAGNFYVSGITDSPDFPTSPAKAPTTGGLFVQGPWSKFASLTEQNITAVGSSGSGVIYAATATHGIFKSSDGGVTWSFAAGFGPVNFIKVDPQNPNNVYLGMMSGLILKSTNGLGTASPLSAQCDGRLMAIDPITPSTIYCSVGGMIWKSTEGGMDPPPNWTPGQGLPGARIVSLAIDPGNHNVLYAALNGPQGIYQSQDFGATWSKVYPGPADIPVSILALAISWGQPAGQLGNVYASDGAGGVVKSTNGGGTWSWLMPSIQRASDAWFCALHASYDPVNNTDVLWAATRQYGMRHSPDGGVTWDTNQTGLGIVDTVLISTLSPYIGNINCEPQFNTAVPGFGPLLMATSLEAGFIAKFNPSGGLGYSELIDGSGADYTEFSAIDAQGNAYITGFTSSIDLPTTTGAQSAPPAGGPYTYVAKLDPSGNIGYLTYLGGSIGQGPNGIAVDSVGQAYVAGWTESSDFPGLGNSAQGMPAPTYPNCASSGSFFIPCVRVFLTQLNATGTAFTSSTVWGGSSNDQGLGFALDKDVNALVSGTVSSTDFPVAGPAFQSTLAGTQDAFLTKIAFSNTQAGAGAVVQPTDKTTNTVPVVMTFQNVVTTGDTTVTTSPTGPAPPAGFSLGNPATYYDIETNATFTGSIQICINYSGVSYNNPSQLQLFHYQGGAWVNVTTSQNTGTSTICGQVTSLSPFMIGSVAPQPAATPTFSPVPGTYIGTQTVAIGDSTAGAIIYYTTNGTTPITSSAQYSVPIAVSANEPLEAIAVANNYTTSAVGSAAYVIQTAQTITFTPESSATYGSSYKLSATGGASGNPVTFAVTSGPANITNGSTLNFTGVGTVMVTASQAGSANYGAAPQVTQSITVNKANLTVKANNVSVPYGTTPVLTAAITGFVNGDALSVVSGAPALATTATSTSLPGSYPISIGQGTLSAANYSFTFIGGTVTVAFTASAPTKGTLCNGAYNGTFSGNLTVSSGQTCIFVGGGVSGNITQSSGNLDVIQSTVGGNITQSGGALEVIQSTVDGNLQVTGGGMFTVTTGSVIKGNLQIQSIPAGSATNQVCGSTVDGNLQFQSNGTAVLIGAAAPATCPGNIIDGNLTIQSNTAAATAVGNTVKGNLTVQSNTAATVVDNNTVSGNLQDESNTAATQVFTNVVGGNLQCQSNTTISGGGNTAKSKQGQCSAY